MKKIYLFILHLWRFFFPVKSKVHMETVLGYVEPPSTTFLAIERLTRIYEHASKRSFHKRFPASFSTKTRKGKKS